MYCINVYIVVNRGICVFVSRMRSSVDDPFLQVCVWSLG